MVKQIYGRKSCILRMEKGIPSVLKGGERGRRGSNSSITDSSKLIALLNHQLKKI